MNEKNSDGCLFRADRTKIVIVTEQGLYLASLSEISIVCKSNLILLMIIFSYFKYILEFHTSYMYYKLKFGM